MRLDKVFIDGTGRIANPDLTDDIRDELRSFRGKHVDITIEAHREAERQRTPNMNAYWHAEPFPKIAAYLHESVARTKLILMGEFWGYEPVVAPSGQKVYIPAKIHTSEMTVAEGSLFTDWLLPWAHERGIEVELPTTWLERQRSAA